VNVVPVPVTVDELFDSVIVPVFSNVDEPSHLTDDAVPAKYITVFGPDSPVNDP
jgi:hypothetical protein